MCQRSQKGAFAALTMWTWCEEAIRAYGFTPHYEDKGDRRTIMLLGPDSPQEMSLTFHKRWLNDYLVQFLGGEIVLWIDRQGKHWTGQHAPNLVPDGYRS